MLFAPNPTLLDRVASQELYWWQARATTLDEEGSIRIPAERRAAPML
jgi:hypothetical protein